MPNGLTDEIINILLSIVDDTNFNMTQGNRLYLPSSMLVSADV